LVRTPFDLVEAEQELTSGYNTEYGSMKFALFFMSEYVKMIALSAIGVTLFLGGWHFPGLQMLGEVVSGAAGAGIATVVVGIVSLLSFMLKVLFLLFLLVWLRASWPRVRYDMLMSIGWKWLLPLALINVVVTAVVVGLAPSLNPLVQGIILLVIGVAVLGGATSLSQRKRSDLKSTMKAVQLQAGNRQ